MANKLVTTEWPHPQCRILRHTFGVVAALSTGTDVAFVGTILWALFCGCLSAQSSPSGQRKVTHNRLVEGSSPAVSTNTDVSPATSDLYRLRVTQFEQDIILPALHD